MSRVDELIQELCPNGVPFLTVGELAVVGTGSSDRKDATDGGEYPFYVRSTDVMRKDSYEFDEEAILMPGEGGIGDIFHYVDGKYALHQRVYRIHFITREVDPKFAYYYFLSHFKRFILSRAVSATVTSIRKPMITDFRLPVPPLEVQQEIARTLDVLGGSRSSLAWELKEELAARRRQYAYYRDSLLGFNTAKDVPWRPLGEMGELIRGRRFTKRDYVDEGGIPVIHYGEIYTHFGTTAQSARSYVRADIAPNLRFARPGDVILTDVGETVDDVGKAVAWLGSVDVAIHDHCYAFRHSMNPAFVAYYMQTNRFRVEKAKYIARTKVKTLLMNGLARVSLPVPPPAEQKRIVDILNKFNALVSDSSGGLGAEISARRAQYEHYRDKLMTFSKATG